jgi:hypothetical protein
MVRAKAVRRTVDRFIQELGDCEAHLGAAVRRPPAGSEEGAGGVLGGEGLARPGRGAVRSFLVPPGIPGGLAAGVDPPGNAASRCHQVTTCQNRTYVLNSSDGFCNAVGQGAMPKREHITGESAFYDRLRDAEFRNVPEIELSDDAASVHVAGAGEPTGRRCLSTNLSVVRGMRAVIQNLRREAWRRQKGQPLWKHRAIPPAEFCPDCVGRGFLEDPVTGEEWPCPVCNPVRYSCESPWPAVRKERQSMTSKERATMDSIGQDVVVVRRARVTRTERWNGTTPMPLVAEGTTVKRVAPGVYSITMTCDEMTSLLNLLGEDVGRPFDELEYAALSKLGADYGVNPETDLRPVDVYRFGDIRPTSHHRD